MLGYVRQGTDLLAVFADGAVYRRTSSDRWDAVYNIDQVAAAHRELDRRNDADEETR